MRIRLFTMLTRTVSVLAILLLALAATPGCEEETEPSLVPPEIESPAATATAPSMLPPPGNAGRSGTSSGATGTSAAPRTTAEYRKAAEAGDVPSMLLLARSHESLEQKGEARKWYARAAEKGNEDAKAALAALDAPPPAANTTTQAPPSSTAPGDIASIGTGSSQALSGPATRRVTTAPLPAGEPGKLRWLDIGAVLNYEDMVSDAQMRPASSRQPTARFMGITTSLDKAITVAAMGSGEGDLDEVTAVIRVRNRVDPGSSPRVAQAGAVAARVTGDNVNQREFLEWVTRYIQNQQRSEPIFRNGWRITVSGFKAERLPDPAPHLGMAVMIEMKK